jgi:adenosylhomocysteine nucleosidase
MARQGPKFPDKTPVEFLVFFAVKEESAAFNRPIFKNQTLISGMGRVNASHAIHSALERFSPRKVFTCGFAGGLNPKLQLGNIVFEEDYPTPAADQLQKLGAIPGKFYCHKRVAVTADEKCKLFLQTGADAVEMESSVIRTICRNRGVPCTTIRVILDTAHANLPLDFNALMTSDETISLPKLIFTLIKSPRKIPELIRFQKETVVAAQRLGELLTEFCVREREIFEKE